MCRQEEPFGSPRHDVLDKLLQLYAQAQKAWLLADEITVGDEFDFVDPFTM